MPDSVKAQIRTALKNQLKDFSTLADTAMRARCQKMLTAFKEMMDAVPSLVFLGASDGPTKPYHFGAYDPVTRHAHFDPFALTDLANSNVQWQVVNTALHEAAHYLGYEHADPPVELFYKGFKMPLYLTEDKYFSDLNPGGQSCMK